MNYDSQARLELYRSRHTIRPTETTTFRGRLVWTCAVDGLLVHRRRSQGRDLWRHDPDAIKALVRMAR